MPLIDMAEAVSRGEIIVDEVDALNAVNSGKLSELETARFSALVAEHSRRQSNGSNYGLNNADLDGSELGASNAAAASDDEHAWNNILVDEVDFVHAAERGRINRRDLYMMGCRSDSFNPARMADDGEFGDFSQDENCWNRILVDEVDILHAAEQGARVVNRSECRLIENETAVPRRNDTIEESGTTVGDESLIPTGRTITSDQPSGE
ncbi:unnamed protein product [Thelazia callipaeda]|uniref:MCM_lid domain-containing protein n=1 Tax=Thelazia callipaeda TaxID=103827 RepID=A0A0N5CZP0_THECL|nr:unnamed protein product [Thelazia callipaeda]